LLDGRVTETANTCAILAPGSSCILTFTPGAFTAAPTSFSIAGDNTETLTAEIFIVADVPGASAAIAWDGYLASTAARQRR
jgi:hypothetical protein